MKPTPPELVEFLHGCIGNDLEIEALPGDASSRVYFRVATARGERFMVAYYPEAVRATVGRFLDAYRAISPHAPVPGVLHHGPCAVVQQDVGDVTLFEVLETDRALGVRLYRQAIDLLVTFQAAGLSAPEVNPPFTAEQFAGELAMTREYWVERMCGMTDRRALQSIEDVFERLAQAIASHPYVLCHRDYHGQNLHVLNESVYIIDYQDLRMGPDTYDLASLLRDRGVARLLADAEDALIEYHRDRTGSDAGQRRRYFETLLQRSIKIVGTFARQSITRDRHHYLAYIPPTLESIRLCIDQLPEYRELLEPFPLEPADARFGGFERVR